MFYFFLLYFVVLIVNCINRKKLFFIKDSFYDVDEILSLMIFKIIKRI